MKVSKLNDKIIFLYFETGHLYLFESESIQIQVRSMKLAKITCSNGTFENTFTESVLHMSLIQFVAEKLFHLRWPCYVISYHMIHMNNIII